MFNPVNINVYCYGANNPVKYVDPDGESATGAVLTWISGDAVIPELTDLAVWKWVGYGAIIIGAAVLDLSIGRVFSNQQKRDIDNVDDPDVLNVKIN